jgi:hypothetical protein
MGKAANVISATQRQNNENRTRESVNYDRIKRDAQRILDKTAFINRLSLAEEQGRGLGGKRNVEASLLLATANRADEKKVRDERERTNGSGAKRQEKLLKDYAKKEGVWFTPDEIERWEYLDAGNEARVYRDPKNPDSVLKVVYNYRNFSDAPLDYFDNRISLHNYIFRDSETEYELIGFTETYGAIKRLKEQFFAPILRQKYVQGGELKKGELNILDYEMEKRGFIKIKRGYASVDYIIRDLNPDNVIITPDGNFRFIDTVPSLNTPENNLGGKREYGDYAIKALDVTAVEKNSAQTATKQAATRYTDSEIIYGVSSAAFQLIKEGKRYGFA